MTNKWGIPPEIESFVLSRDKACVYCGCAFNDTIHSKKRSWEHIINDIQIINIDNIALCCIGCNASKGAKELKDWLQSDHAKRRGITELTLANVVKNVLKECE